MLCISSEKNNNNNEDNKTMKNIWIRDEYYLSRYSSRELDSATHIQCTQKMNTTEND